MVKNGGVNIHYWEKRMTSKIPENLIKILKQIGETRESSTWDCHGTAVVKHHALEKIANMYNINFDNPIVIETDIKNKCVAIMVKGYHNKGSAGKVEAWSIGEATPYNNKNIYPYAMAEKRAKDRVILKLIGISGDVYSEEEGDNLKNSKPKGVN